MQSTGHTSTQAVSFTPRQGSAMIWVMATWASRFHRFQVLRRPHAAELHDVVFDLVTGLENREAAVRHGALTNQHIALGASRMQQAVAFVGIEPLDGAAHAWPSATT